MTDSPETVKSVARFVEKPDRETALSYLASGDYYWNAGIFLVRADILINSLSKYASDLLKAVRQAVKKQKPGW